MREIEKELNEAQTCVVDFERAMAKKDFKLKQKDSDLKQKNAELRKDQLLTAFAARLKEQLRDVGAESWELRAELEEAKRDIQTKDEELSKLFDKID